MKYATMLIVILSLLLASQRWKHGYDASAQKFTGWESDSRGVKEESEKFGLQLNIQKTKIMASGPITSWEIDGETVSDFIFGGSKITADGDCSHEIKDTYSLEGKLWAT